MTFPAPRAGTAPLLPDSEDAREWVRRELSDPAYDIAEPTFLDRAARAVAEFFERLLNAQLSGGWGPAVAVGATVVVVALLVAAIVVWGRPRASARVRRTPGAALFGDADARTAAQLRADAEAAAARGDWDEAIVLRFRALAQGLTERAIVEPPPGQTAQRFARDAARAFPARSSELLAAASAFDDVRYLRRPGTAALYDAVARLDDAVAVGRPHLAGAPL
ncbi:DUF4129 domain-containing protein [Microbacterium sp. RD1]|uniref:DUF4129 domain-containing protein n=1 Tax=Microbacterium sp. RD1 TaxID=3457313 RepID=UPI003FA58A3B